MGLSTRAFNPSLARSHPSRGRNLLHSTLKSIDNATKITGEKERKKKKKQIARVAYCFFDSRDGRCMLVFWNDNTGESITVNGVAKKRKKRDGEWNNEKDREARNSIFCCHRCSANVFCFGLLFYRYTSRFVPYLVPHY